MINLNQLRIFQAVTETHSFTRAAEVVHLTQPGISKHIKQMEEYYGAPLFDRLGKNGRTDPSRRNSLRSDPRNHGLYHSGGAEN